MSNHTSLAPTVEHATTDLANMSLDPDSDNDTDSTGSVPDLVPATDSDNDAGDEMAIHPTTPIVQTDTRAVNRFINRELAQKPHKPHAAFVHCATTRCYLLDVQLWEAAFITHHKGITRAPLSFPTLSCLPRSRGNAEDVPSPHSTSPSPQPPVRRGPLDVGYHANAANGPHSDIVNLFQNTGHTTGSSNQNWRGPAHLAHRAFRDAIVDRLTNQGFVNRPAGNNPRRGGAPYQAHAGRVLNGEMIYDLIMRLQRLERALQGLTNNTEQHWLPRHF
ncbi:hypothetical protein FB451DRAFT_1194281 [Mycena latifolia]|nr:hypothetical protein FB451DRAFT_1194281 [Mycena latifolia]